MIGSMRTLSAQLERRAPAIIYARSVELLADVVDGVERFELEGARWIAVERNCAGDVWLAELANVLELRRYLREAAAGNESPHDYLPWLLLDTWRAEWRPLVPRFTVGEPFEDPGYCGKLDWCWSAPKSIEREPLMGTGSDAYYFAESPSEAARAAGYGTGAHHA